MLTKILIPVDGSPLADQILVQVRRILTRQDAELLLLRVLPPKPVTGKSAPWEEEVRKAQEHLDGLQQRLAREGIRVRGETRSGNPAEEILKYADTCRPGLVAMSTHGRSGLVRWIRGSIAERVLERTAFPLLTANPAGLERGADPAELRFRRILLPLDGSEMSAAVVNLVIHFAKLYDADVTLFFAAMFLPSPAMIEMSRDISAEEALPVLEPYRKKIEQAGVPVRVSTTMGYPAEEILQAVEREKADLVAMTTHGRSGLSRWLYGSVAEKVLRHCRVPLLVHRTSGFAG